MLSLPTPLATEMCSSASLPLQDLYPAPVINRTDRTDLSIALLNGKVYRATYIHSPANCSCQKAGQDTKEIFSAVYVAV